MSSEPRFDDAATVRGAFGPLLAVLVGCIVPVGCGVSLQSVYEGNVRFEHCHRLDMDDRVTPSYRARCWREWLDHYTFGQTRDRVDYANRRLRELGRGDTSPRVGLDRVAGEPVSASESRAPTSRRSPPPPAKRPAPADAGPVDARPEARPEGTADGPDPPASPCVEECHRTWRGCIADCKDDQARCAACGKDYRKCMQRCFKDQR